MVLRFSDHGPEFPSALVDALMANDVVFLCGTGISAPQLPDFKSLVDNTYASLGLEKEMSELESYKNQRYEEVLGTLGRRLADPMAMTRTVSELLAMPAEPRLDQHRTILRLSRDRNNRIITVTTNFDTLLERALGQPAVEGERQSFAGQSLPTPGSADFAGIIHIHGRLIDPTLDLEATPLILTSADYGDAYMRSGWASRFLFDLARCKTIVLIGYSANDAPVRYFLNVLEADRARFPDLRSVYAFDAYEHCPVEAEARWGALAVTPLVYRKLNPSTDAPDHSPLWGDLHKLADFIERPQQSRHNKARDILSGDGGNPTDQQLRELRWLFTNGSDLWSVALDAITDPRWFHVFQNHKFWSAHDAASVVSDWTARNFEDRQRFATAIEWHEILGRDFLAFLDQRLGQSPPASSFWLKAWRILLSTGPTERANIDNFNKNACALEQKIKSCLILDGDLAQSILLLAPVLVARPTFRINDHKDEAAQATEPRLSNVVSLNLSVVGRNKATDIIAALNALEDHALRILELGSEALHSSLRQSVDLEMIFEDYDKSDLSVPSVEDHSQNEYHNGVIFLVRMIVNAFPKAVVADRARARAQAAQWIAWPGRMGARLLLHVSRDAAAFSADEALQVLLDIDDKNFWIIRREIALTLRDRAAEATPALRGAVEARVRTNGDAYYAHYPLEEGQVDWRAHARDSEVWLRLKMIEDADVLSDKGRKELSEIIKRLPYLDRAVEERDLFGSYRYSTGTVVGDSSPIVEADPDDRIKVATSLSQSPNINCRLGWSAYCRSNPKGAFEALAAVNLTPPNIVLWDDLLATLDFRQDDDKGARLHNQLAVDALTRLEDLSAEALRPIAARAVDLLMFGPRRKIAHLEDWCDRLWKAVRTADCAIDFDESLYETAINHAAGRLAHILLIELDNARKETKSDEARWRERLALAAKDSGPARIIACAVFVHDLSFMLLADRQLVEDCLLPRLTAKDDVGRALREVLVSSNNITPEVTKVAREAVLLGVIEARTHAGSAAHVAAGILRPALASFRGEDPDRWGIDGADVRRALRSAPLKIRISTLDVLVRWMEDNGAGAEDAWEKMVAPFFESIWPKDRRFVDNALNVHLMSLAVGAGKHFPDALAKLQPYLSPYADQCPSILPIRESAAPEQFPDHVLNLLWRIFGQTGGNSYGMKGVLDRLLEANPEIEVDRRFQSLVQRTAGHRHL